VRHSTAKWILAVHLGKNKIAIHALKHKLSERPEADFMPADLCNYTGTLAESTAKVSTLDI
jgi:hypothetical protein